MRTFTIFCAAMFVTALIAGCGEPKEPLYQGLPLKVWVKRLEAPEPEIRADALEVIADVGNPARAAEQYVRNLARNDPSTEVRMLAIKALEAMDVPVVEFQDFLDAYYAPIIPDSEEYFDDMAKNDEDEELNEKISGDDDLSYLKAFEENKLDSMASRLSDMMPKDSAEYQEWLEERQAGEVLNLLNQLSNPKMLAKILEIGNAVEREFAARRLGEIPGDDPDIIEALEKASNDTVDIIRQAAEEALHRWMPEE